MSVPILVTGPTGNAGQEVVRGLLERGIAVRAALRDPARIRRPEADALSTVAFDFERPDTFAAAFEGVERVFLVRPPAISDVKRFISPAIDAAAAAGVRRVVFLSLLGVEKNPVVPHRRIEAHLRQSGMAYTFLRAGFFMQNLSTVHRSDIRERNRLFVPAGSGRTSFVDVRDVAEAGVVALTEPGHENRAYDLTGPEALRYDEVARILSRVLGRTITYPDPSVVSFIRHMRRLGHSWGSVLVMSGLYTSAKLGLAGRLADGVQQVLGRPPRSFETFARDNRACWEP